MRIVTTSDQLVQLLKYFVQDTRADKPWADADDEWVEGNLNGVLGAFFDSLYAVTISDGHEDEWHYFDTHKECKAFFKQCAEDGEDVHAYELTIEGVWQVIGSHSSEEI